MEGYVLSRQADADLVDIFAYTLEVWGEEQVVRYRDMIVQAIESLLAAPTAPSSKSREDLASRCRTYRVGHHYIVYRIGEGRLEIGRILHERMFFEKQVSDRVFP